MLSEKPWKSDEIPYLLGGLLICMSFGSVLSGIVLSLPVFKEAENPDFASTILVTAIFFHLPILALVHWSLRGPGATWASAFGFSRDRWKRWTALGVFAAFLGLLQANLIGNGLDWLFTKLGTEAVEQKPVTVLRDSNVLWEQIVFGIHAVLLAPFVEEVMFRGVLYPIFKQMGYRRLSLWGTSILFGLIHSNLLTFIPLTIFAVMLVHLYEETDNLAAPILAHALFNATNFAILIWPKYVA